MVTTMVELEEILFSIAQQPLGAVAAVEHKMVLETQEVPAAAAQEEAAAVQLKEILVV
tara:strand:- start:225 stop:398 length:174 start_codon:yes stop_codon:yes gene_type:complete